MTRAEAHAVARRLERQFGGVGRVEAVVDEAGVVIAWVPVLRLSGAAAAAVFAIAREAGTW